MSPAPVLALVEQEARPDALEAALSYPPLPHVIDAEQAVLGMMMVENKAVPQIAAIVAEADFYEPLHQRIFAAALRIDGEGRPVFPLSLRTALGEDQGLKEVGWTYLTDLAEAGSNVGERRCLALARDIATTAIRRRAMIAIWEAQEELASPPKRPVTEILAPVVSAADEAAEQSRDEIDPSVSECAFMFLRELENGTQAKPAFKTGLAKLDDELGGFFGSDLIIIGGRPGMMKSALLTCLARSAATGGNRVDLFSIEMSRRDNMTRILCDIDYDSHPDNPLWYKKLTRGNPTPHERERAAEAAVLLGRHRIDIHDSGTMTMPQIAGIARARAARLGKPALVAIDHLQIVRASNPRHSRYEIMTEASAGAKALAKSIGCPVIALCQLNRDVEKRGDKERMPMLADLRESGSIEQDADLIIMLYRPAFYLWQKRPRDPYDPKMGEWKSKYDEVKHDLEISVPKHRHGAMFDCRLFVEPGASAIRDERPAPSNDYQRSTH